LIDSSHIEPLLAAAEGFSFARPYAIGLFFAGLVMFTAIWILSSHGRRSFSPAAVYLLLGALASGGLHFFGIDLIDPIEESALIERLAEFAVIVALFGAGLRIDRQLGWDRWRSTILLIVVVMPLTIGAVTLFASTLMGLSLGAAIILGACLAPTDPVLARDVQVGPPGEGDKTETHFALTSEAGFNDGLAFPFVFLGIFVAAEGGTGWLAEWFAADVVYGIAGGLAIGAVGGWVIGRGADWFRKHGWLKPTYDGWLAMAAVLAIYGFTEIVGAYGFLAAFAGGLSFRRYEWDHQAHDRVHGGADLLENITELGMVLLLGSTVTIAGLAAPGLAGWLLIPVLLILIRPTAVLASFVGSAVAVKERFLIGWFGIRGIGSFYYAAVAINAGVLTVDETNLIYWTIIACVGVSIFVHGFTAGPAMATVDDASRDATIEDYGA
jgi:NhaP-type Na+/H+ or K+/H+ antiporter